MMRRCDQWPERLHDYVQQASVQTFAWGEHDCALFAVGAVKAMTGEDLGAEFRNRYRGRISAVKFVKKKFGGTVEEALAAVMTSAGCPEIVVGKAQRGDVVLLREEEGATVAIVHPSGALAVTVAREGIVCRPLGRAVRAWRV